jgi:hypothetical protein
MQAAKMVGPLGGGLLLAAAGPAPCYLALGALHGAALAGVHRLHRRVALPAVAAPTSVLGSLAEGLREVQVRPPILRVLAITVVMNALVFPYQQMLPVFARDVLAVGPGLLGLLVAAEGAGALAGSLAIAARRHLAAHARLFAGASLAAAGGLFAFALSPAYPLSLALQVAIGAAESGFGTMQSAIVLLAAPEQARGRAMGILSMCIGTQPLGSLWAGFLTARVGAPAATATDAALALLLMLPVGLRMVRFRS